jgi:hypothetical protein
MSSVSKLVGLIFLFVLYPGMKKKPSSSKIKIEAV